jgi:hypothetical protein
MYRIELTPGEVTVFRTIEELATGVRNGLITPKARIYHSASDKWLPIEFHPHYKQALDLNAAQAADAAGHKHGTTSSKHTALKQGSSKSGDSKARKDRLTFLNVPLSPVTPAPRPKPRVADLPYIEDDSPAARSTGEHTAADRSSAVPAPVNQAQVNQAQVNQAQVHQAPVNHLPENHAPVIQAPVIQAPVIQAPVIQAPENHAPENHAPVNQAPVNDAPVGRSPGYDLDHEPSLDQPPAVDRSAAHNTPAHNAPAYNAPKYEVPAYDVPAYDAPKYEAPKYEAPKYEAAKYEAQEHQAAEHDTPAHFAPVDRGPGYDAGPDHQQPFKRMLADDTPVYRSPAERSANHEAEAHAAFEAHLLPEPIRIEEPIHLEERIRDASRSRLAVEELFAPPASRAPSLPLVSASPVLELPKISYPEITPAEPPVAERSSGGSRARRSLHLAGAVLLLAAGGYASTTVFSFGRSDGGFNAASTIADRPVVPVSTTAPSAEAAPAPPGVEARAAATAPAPARHEPPHALSPKASTAVGTPLIGSSLAGSAAEGPLAPGSSGFAPALESRAIVNVPLKPTPKPDPVTDSSAIAPAIDMQVTVPEVQTADSLAPAPRQKNDSAMKRILRAVSGTKDAP